MVLKTRSWLNTTPSVQNNGLNPIEMIGPKIDQLINSNFGDRFLALVAGDQRWSDLAATLALKAMCFNLTLALQNRSCYYVSVYLISFCSIVIIR